MKIILASSSPRRKELMESAGLKFEIITSSADENVKYTSPEDLVEKLSVRKAQIVAKDHRDAIVIGADTIVELDGEIIGKPKTKERAIEMLSKMQSRWHSVYTGVTLCCKDKQKTFVVHSRVKFHELTKQDILDYIENVNVLDKAGAYGIQDGRVVEQYEGSYTNIVGLPMDELLEELKEMEK